MNATKHTFRFLQGIFSAAAYIVMGIATVNIALGGEWFSHPAAVIMRHLDLDDEVLIALNSMRFQDSFVILVSLIETILVLFFFSRASKAIANIYN